MTTIAFAALRALGWVRPEPIAPPAPVRLSDPAGDAITRDLIEAGLWRYDCNIGLVRNGGRLTVRVFFPEHQQSDRSAGASHATLVKAVLEAALRAEGFSMRFVDALFYERGKKGWAVVACAQERS